MATEEKISVKIPRSQYMRHQRLRQKTKVPVAVQLTDASLEYLARKEKK